ncbi:sialidase family protein [Pedobacter sp. Du54]|uniref:sialidase family protein n=1 Tax=Pedobacter anseongensis TaxID=3133439 RepID=UPI00309D5EAF
MDKIKLIFVTIFLQLLVAPSFAQRKITQQKYQLPLLIGKEHNPVLKLTIIGTDEELLDKLSIGIPSNGEDISHLNIFSTGTDSTQLTDAKLQKATGIATAKEIKSGELQLKTNYKLKSGKNYFWLTLALKPNANLNHKLNITVNSITLNAKTVKVDQSTTRINQAVAVALRQHLQENVNTHRIPGIATAKDGSLLAIYDARRNSARDLQGDIDIGLSRSTDKGKTWLPMQVILDMGEWGGLPQKFNGVSDPCILVDRRTGTIYVAGLWMHGVLDENGKWIEGLNEQSEDWNHQWKAKGSQPGFDPKQTAQFLITKSIDNGKTWSKPVNITKMCKKEEWWLFAPAPGAGITLKDGTLVFPTQGRTAKGAFSNITYSKDNGKTWETSKPAASESTTENMAVELSDGRIMLNMRTGKNNGDTSATNGRVIATTNNLGKTWTTHPTSHGALPEPGCMASIIRYDYTKNGITKSMLIFCNPDSKTARNKITLKISHDDGNTWQKKLVLDEWKGRGYSCLTNIDKNTIGVIYESSQANLVFQSVKIEELLK